MMKDNTIVQQETSAGDYKQTEEIENSDATITISPFEAAIQSFIEYKIHNIKRFLLLLKR